MMLSFWLPLDKAYWKPVCFITWPAEHKEINTVLKNKTNKSVLSLQEIFIWDKFTESSPTLENKWS